MGRFLVLGIFIGSYIAARGAKEFKWRLPDKITIRNSAIGGICMGFGASVAGGCSIGNGLVATATLSWQGWIALASMILGTWFMSYFIFVRPMKQIQNKQLNLLKYLNKLKQLNYWRTEYVIRIRTVGMVCPFPLIEAQKKMETLKMVTN